MNEAESSPKSNLKIYLTLLLILLGVVGCVQLSHYYSRLPKIQRLGVRGYMESEADDAVTLAKDLYKIDLDYSEESIKDVEQILAQSHDRYLQDPDAKRSLTPVARANLWGAYIGEVIKTAKKSEWKLDPETQAITLQLTEEAQQPEFMPMKWCYLRITEGKPQDNVWLKYLLVTSDSDPSDPKHEEIKKIREQFPKK